MPGKPALIAEGVGYVLDSDVSRIRKQRPEADAGISGDGAMRGHTTQKITPDTLGTIPHPLLFLISGRPKGGVSGAVADRAAISVAVTGTSLTTAGVFGFARPAPAPLPTWPGLASALLVVPSTAAFPASAAVEGAQSEHTRSSGSERTRLPPQIRSRPTHPVRQNIT